MKSFMLAIFSFCLVSNCIAQKKKGQLPQVAIKPAPAASTGSVSKADLLIENVRVNSVTENSGTNMFETNITVTIRNKGNAATTVPFQLDLRSKYGTRSGGTDYSPIGANKVVTTVVKAFSTMTVTYTATKNITQMGRARLECVVRVDVADVVPESDENNNASAVFTITPPRP